MPLSRRICAYIAFVLLMVTTNAVGTELSGEDVVRAIADRLEYTQIKVGTLQGSWLSEGSYTGAMAAGMVGAYEWLGQASYNTCAWRAGSYIMETIDVQGNLLGDEAYAFVRLSGTYPPSAGPAAANVWRIALQSFYSSMRNPIFEGSTEAYLRYFEKVEPSTAVFYLAHHVVAVYHVGDQDRELWRDGLIRHLSRVSDESTFPVTALGAATWALAKTDGLKSDIPLASDVASSQWSKGVVLADLPALLMSHQVPEGQSLAGSFYWRFDHTSGGRDIAAAGYTEDAIFGALGLVAAASRVEQGPVRQDMERAIAAAHKVLLQGADAEGKVYEHLSGQGETYHAFAGEMLEALWTVRQHLEQKSAAEAQPSAATAPSVTEAPKTDAVLSCNDSVVGFGMR